MEKKYTDINSSVIDSWVKDGWEWSVPVTHEEYLKALDGDWGIFLTPTKVVPHEWFGNLKGKKVLGLASGGGQQGPMLQAQGADVTILDYSQEQLKREREVAEREDYDITVIRADMTERLPFEDESFDIIVHPVSNCYIQDVQHVWNECYRILKKGGILMAGLDNGINFLYNDEETEMENVLPYNPLINPEQMEQAKKDNVGVQFSHTIEEQIDGQIRAGFTLTNVYGDTNGYGNLHEHNVDSFWGTRAVKQ
ncbi:MAG: methyltransferase domain-containing protein [Clostridia bacterium]|nr:methyltransferase domain-containing protein [Clostridia bacterium]